MQILCVVNLALVVGATAGVRDCDVAFVVGFLVIEGLLSDPVLTPRRSP
jgi:hypothetical protein